MSKIKSGYELNKLAQKELVKPIMNLDLVFEQVNIIYRLSCFSGSHDISEISRKALKEIYKEYLYTYDSKEHSMNMSSADTCAIALSSGIHVISELPRSEYVLAYVETKKLLASKNNTINYLRTFNDKG